MVTKALAIILTTLQDDLNREPCVNSVSPALFIPDLARVPLLTLQTNPRNRQVSTTAATEAADPKTPRYPRSVQAMYLKPLRRDAEFGVPSCDLQLRSYSIRNLEFFCDFALRAAYYLNLPAFGPVPLPRLKERWTVPRSTFIFKKSQENFERITLRRLIQIRDGNPETVQVWLAFLQKHAYYGIGMKANVWEFSKLGKKRSLLGPHRRGVSPPWERSRLTCHLVLQVSAKRWTRAWRRCRNSWRASGPTSDSLRRARSRPSRRLRSCSLLRESSSPVGDRHNQRQQLVYLNPCKRYVCGHNRYEGFCSSISASPASWDMRWSAQQQLCEASLH